MAALRELLGHSPVIATQRSGGGEGLTAGPKQRK